MEKYANVTREVTHGKLPSLLMTQKSLWRLQFLNSWIQLL